MDSVKPQLFLLDKGRFVFLVALQICKTLNVNSKNHTIQWMRRKPKITRLKETKDRENAENFLQFQKKGLFFSQFLTHLWHPNHQNFVDHQIFFLTEYQWSVL